MNINESLNDILKNTTYAYALWGNAYVYLINNIIDEIPFYG